MVLSNSGRLVLKKILLGILLVCSVISFAGRINITNETGNYRFFFVHISPASSDSWGEDQLGSDEVISPGASRKFHVDNGTFDIKIIDEDEDEYIFWNVYVNGALNLDVSLDDLGEQDWDTSSSNSTSDGLAPVSITNELGDWTIWYVYANPSDSDSWGEDRLGSELLEPGDTFTFYLSANDSYDFKVEDEDGDTYTFRDAWIDEDGVYWNVSLDEMD